MAKLVNQDTPAPTRKVAVGGIAGSLTVVLVYIIGLFGIELPAEVVAALTALIQFGAAYFVREEA